MAIKKHNFPHSCILHINNEYQKQLSFSGQFFSHPSGKDLHVGTVIIIAIIIEDYLVIHINFAKKFTLFQEIANHKVILHLEMDNSTCKILHCRVKALQK